MMKKKLVNNQSGQIALVVLLIMIVILTIALSVVSQSLTDMKISLNEKEALRAFSAAEAGIEEILSRATLPTIAQTIDVPVASGLNASVRVSPTGEGAKQTINDGEAMTINLSGATATALIINWIDKTMSDETSNKASIEVVIYSNTNRFKRYAIYPNDNSHIDDFTSESTAGDGVYHRKTTISGIAGSDVLARIRPLYNKATIMVTSNNGSLPLQQYNLTSVANVTGDKTSQVAVTRTIPTLPTIFDYVLFTGGDITK